MRIGIISSGPAAGALARLFLKAGHEVAVGWVEDGAEPGPIVDELGDRAVQATVAEAAGFGPVVVVSLTPDRYPELPTDALAGRTVVEAGSPRKVDLRADATSGGPAGSLADQLPGAQVVRAFDTIGWDRLREHGRQSSAQQRYPVPVSGDQPEAKRVVFDLVEQLGYQPVDGGPLRASSPAPDRRRMAG